MLAQPEDGIAFRRGSFWYHRGNVVYNIHDADRDTHTLHGVSVFRLNARGPPAREPPRGPRRRRRGRLGPQRRDAALLRSVPSGSAPRTERVSEKVARPRRHPETSPCSTPASSSSRSRSSASTSPMRAADGRDRGRRARPPAPPLGGSAHGDALRLARAAARLRGRAHQEPRRVRPARDRVGLRLLHACARAASLVASAGVALAAIAPWLLLAAFGGFGAWRLARIPE